MNLTPDHIDQFLRNELSPAEMEAFQSQMNIDPVLQEQVLYEQAIQRGFSDLRKAELKTRLNAIQITTPWYGNWGFADGTMVKIIGSAAVATIIGVSGYLFLGEDQKSEMLVTSSIVGTIDHPQKSSIIEWEIQDVEKTLVENQKTSPVSKEIIAVKPAEKQAVVTASINTEKTNSYNPNVQVPQFIEPVLDQGLDAADVSFEKEITKAEVASTPTSNIEIQSVDKKSETLRYKFFDGKLFLYGNFNNSPYEILEINTAKEKDVYLIFENQYYKLQNGDGIKSLEPITNEALLKDLMIIRNNKQ